MRNLSYWRPRRGSRKINGCTAIMRTSPGPWLVFMSPKHFACFLGIPWTPRSVHRCFHFHFFGSLFDERGHRIWLRYVNRVTARDLDDARPRALRHETLGRRWDHLVVSGHQ